MTVLAYRADVGDAERYRKQAEEARWMAAYSHKPESKEVWLRIADAWADLASQASSSNDPPDNQEDQVSK